MGIQGLSTALTGLYAAQKAIDTTGNNIANANTDGYTRQRVELSPTGNGTNSFWNAVLPVGTGVTVTDIKRLRDQYLEANVITTNANQGNADRLTKTYAGIESTFGEPSDTGIQKQLANYWDTWDKLAKDPGGSASRTAVIETAKTLTSAFNDAATSLTKAQSDALSELRGNVDEINSITKSIADLSDSVTTIVGGGGDVNNLLDRRDSLIKQLSKLGEVTTSTSDNGMLTVTFGGSTIVKGNTFHALNVDASGSPVKIRMDDGDGDPTTGNEVGVKSGDTGGLLQSINVVIPSYQQKLDDAANAVINAVNTLHTGGKDLYGNAGVDFFSGTSAASMQVNPTVATDPKRLAASSSTGGTLDGSNAAEIGKLATGATSPNASYTQLINVLGIESQRAQRQSEIQASVASAASDAATSVSGVNIDEEMTNLIQSQHAYAANAEYLSTINEVLDSLLSIIR